MEQEEFDEDVEACAECGAVIAPDTDAAFRFGEDRALCFECAVRRHGEYDEGEDRWTVPPDLSGLEEAVPEG